MKMRFMTLSLLSFLWLLPMLSEASTVGRDRRGTMGDGDVFPHSCVSFAGEWRADDGNTYLISQNNCAEVAIRRTAGSVQNPRDSLTIVPDNKYREVINEQGTLGVQRHYWNSENYGTAIRTVSRFFEDEWTETEEVVFEQVNAWLLLETTFYRREFLDSSPSIRRSSQRIFRRVEGGAEALNHNTPRRSQH